MKSIKLKIIVTQKFKKKKCGKISVNKLLTLNFLQVEKYLLSILQVVLDFL